MDIVGRIPGVLAEFPDLDADPTRMVWREKGSASDRGCDLRLLVTVDKQEWEIRAEVKAVGHPKRVREAAFWLKRSIGKTKAGRKVYPVFIAPYISPESAKVCEQEGVGYLDLSGNCHLAFGGVYIDIQGQVNQFKDDRMLKSLYSPKAERILRVMLANPIRPWRVQELADECEVSLGQVSKVRKLMLEREWARDMGNGIEVCRPESVLKTWQAERPRNRGLRKEFFTLDRAASFEARIPLATTALGQKGALTGLAAAARLAPMSRYLRTSVLVEDIEAFAYELGLKRVETGANVVLIQPADEGIFYGLSKIEGVPVVSPVQVYLDLIADGGRWEEAAEALFNQVIQKEWHRKTA
jgi:hypothetical protein